MHSGERADVAMPRIQAKITELEGALLQETAAVDATAKELFAKDPAAAVEYVTAFGVETGAEMLSTWRGFWMELFSLTRDFMVVTAPKQKQCAVGAPLGRGAAHGANTTCTSRSLPEASDRGTRTRGTRASWRMARMPSTMPRRPVLTWVTSSTRRSCACCTSSRAGSERAVRWFVRYVFNKGFVV